MATNFAIKTVIGVVDKATGPIRRISATILRSTGGAMRGVSDIAAGATVSTGKLAGSMAMLGGAAALGGLAVAGKAYLDTAGELADFARVTGVGVEALQELEFAAKLTGVESEELRSALQGLGKGIGQAKAGTGKLAGFLGKVSPVLLAQVKAAKSTDEAFALIVDAMKAIPDPARRAALAAAAFGGAGAKMVRFADDGVDGLDKLRGEARALGVVLSADAVSGAADAGDGLDKLFFAIKGVSNSIIRELLPALTPMVDKLVDWFKANKSLITLKIQETIKAIALAIRSVDWGQVVEKVKEIALQVKALWDRIGGLEGAVKIWAGVLALQAIPALVAFGGALVKVGGAAKSLWAIMMANPLLAAAALLAFAIGLVIANWADFEEFGAELWRTLKQLWIDGVKNITDLWDELSRNGRQTWVDLKAFFTNLWAGILGVFDASWARIAAIVDRVQGAVSTITGGMRSAAAAVGLTGEAPASASPAGAGGPGLASGGPIGAALAQLGAAQVGGEIRVTFDGAPAGTRATTSTPPGQRLDLSTAVGRRSMAGGAL